jgi:hypothetical protein
MLIFIGLGLCLAGGLWWWHRPAHPKPVNASIYETDMVADLVRELLTELPAPVPAVCFLAFGVGETPPSQRFIARFTGSHPTVRGCDSAVMPPVNKRFEISTGKPGLMIHVVQFKQIISGTFDVLVSFSHLPEGRNRFTYRVSNASGAWKIKSRTAG